MASIYQQIAAKIISIIANLIIAIGIVEMPVLPPNGPIHINRQTRQALPQEISEGQTKQTIIEIKKEVLLAPKQEQPKPVSSPPISTPPVLQQTIQTIQQTPLPKEPEISLADLNKKIRGTIVNIFCTTKTAGAFKPITASGVIISSKGIVLINAHMGQYFLVEEERLAGYLSCVIRNGDIAKIAYDAKLIYIPSVWVETNADSIIQQAPKGTGENDYALLLINQSLVQGKELPSLFLFDEQNFDFNDLPADLFALLASYPAGFLGGISVQKDLGLVSTFAPVKALYTFSEKEPKTLDIFSLGGNIASQSGSSGGGVFDTRDGKLLGIIVTSSEATTTSGRILNAITLPHISRSFKKYTGKNLIDFLSGNPDSFSQLLSDAEFNRLKNILLEKLLLNTE